MINPFNKGDTKTYSTKVQASDIAKFTVGVVHSVYSTFAIARDAEWACRLFVLEMKESDEEGIGTFAYVNHHAPAKVGANITITSVFEELRKNEIICSFKSFEGKRLLASGKTGQKILKKERISKIMNDI